MTLQCLQRVTFPVKNKCDIAGRLRAALSLHAATSPVSCRLRELELAPSGPSSRQVALSDALPETHTLFIGPIQRSHVHV